MLIPDGSRSQWKWIRHDLCLWNAPPLLRQVIRLRPHYQDCENLFTKVLGIKQASLDEVVHEFCSESRGNKKSALQRFEKLLLMLADFLSKSGRGLTVSELARIRTASVFPVLQKGEVSQEDPVIVWRSIRDGGWYIPDKIMLENLFRGKIDMLGMSVRLLIKSSRLLGALFTALGCTTMLVSSSVRQTIELRGNIVRDLQMETDLKIRVEHISQ